MKSDVSVPLDIRERSTDAIELERSIRNQIIGQEEAVAAISDSIQIFSAGLHNPDRPVGSLLFLGPTGTGKTRVVEATAKALFGTEKAVIKLNCAEFKEAHQISRLIGAPSGYVGHKDTAPLITQEKLNKYHTPELKLSLLLLDEVEKGSPALWDLFLNIMDRASMTRSDGDEIDFRRCLIVMTSNAGARQIQDAVAGGLGFSKAAGSKHKDLRKISQEAARRNFSPEFWGRLDQVVTFHSLSRQQLLDILELEISNVQRRILASANHQQFVLKCTPEAKEFILNDKTDLRYGARDLQYSVQRNLLKPLSVLLSTGQVTLGDLVRVHHEGVLKFDKIPAEAVSALPQSDWAEYMSPGA